MKISHLFTTGFVLLALAATGCKTDGVEKEEARELTSGLLLENMDTLVKPGDDFMAYVNGTWIRNTEIPSDKSSYGSFYMLYEESQENVKKIIEESSEGTFPEGSDEQKVGDLYSSYMDMEKRNALGVSPLNEEFAKIDGISSYEELAAYFAYANKVGFSVPLELFIYQDFKKPTEITVYTEQSGLGPARQGILPERRRPFQRDQDQIC